ncbi:LPS export ABC transporter periplasmic protein LptC [Arcobacter lacus]|jgi:hypothetical protein|uniref:LPS export ABC transporter periplasmic protein LptC n=1 Tax=Arcobacter lacus TaxID=1912876 RepID=A0ABX5JLQ5_9BACT|nr:LPS export ABC transporter periplasmic protein LptC [Arcobacter lacus]MCT7909145.1 LPS export ABC transporter periplasmic protein LptC [Arcobacter lacus]MCT7911406.1 LPS export ABC transporter periplasmic protein LptC [Arcobacter lacus]PUE66291.1 hypothetical protein B0175_06165 [Arcobacter lacus]
MAIKSFITTLLVVAFIVYFIPTTNINKNQDNKDIPLLIFEKPVMYTLNENSVNRVVIASNAVRYENRDEMFNADIILKNQDPSQDFNNERLNADKIVKRGGIYTLTDNVKYKRDDFIKINTNYLIYDDINKIAKNDKPFESVYNSHSYKGTNLYLDLNNSNIKSKNAHFEIDLNKTKKEK